MVVEYQGGMAFKAKARGHEIRSDLPEDKGGQDSGMTPPEVFISSLGSCVGVYVAKYCQNAKIAFQELNICLDWSFSDDKKSISKIDIKVSLPGADIGKRSAALMEVARHCLIHHTILGQPQINFALEGHGQET